MEIIEEKESIKNKVRKKIKKYRSWILGVIVIISIIAVVIFYSYGLFLPIGGEIA